MANQKKTAMDGTVRSITKVEREKKDTTKEFCKVVIMNEEGGRADLTLPLNKAEDFCPEDNVTVQVTPANKTIKEALGE